MAGGANLNLQVMESPLTNVCCLILSAGVGEACRPTGLTAAADETRLLLTVVSQHANN